MIAGKKYEPILVDIWSCGIILYAMLCGYLPFEDPNTTLLYKKILKGKFELPDFLSEDAKDFLIKILNVNPAKRFRISDIYNHKWFTKSPPIEPDEGIIVGTTAIPVLIFKIIILNRLILLYWQNYQNMI